MNPVPHVFERIDFPLQTLSANTARGFAHLLGLYPTGEQLQMMFAPKFGMVIVPGCNGVRGSATMVYLAILIGYLRRMGRARTGLLMLLGLATGYLLNLTRLCVLVIYYWVGIHFPRLRGDGELIDYCIGGTLFLLVSFLAGYLLFRPGAEEPRLGVPLPRRIDWLPELETSRWIVTGLLLLVAVGTEVPSAWAMLSNPSDYVDPARAAAALPQTAGTWHSGRRWQENYYDHPVWLWTTYTRTDGATVDFAVWLSPKRHFAIQSRLMNGSKPLLGQPLQAQAMHALPMTLSTFTLQDDLVEHSLPVPTFFAETVCLPSHCSVQESGFQRTGWVVAIMPSDLRTVRRLPVLYRVQAREAAHETPETQQRAREWIADLIAQTDVRGLTETLGAR